MIPQIFPQMILKLEARETAAVGGLLGLALVGKGASQKHGFTWETDILKNVYQMNATQKYTSEFDCPASCNNLDGVNLSIKTTGSNSVSMGDILRIYNATHSNEPYHMTVIRYDQTTTTTKEVVEMVEVDLTASGRVLFGDLTLSDIESIVDAVKEVPHKRRPTPEERARMYAVRDGLLTRSGCLSIAIKCDSRQSRVQCSFSNFRNFLTNNSRRIISHSSSNEFRGGSITSTLNSTRRVRRKII